VLRNLPNRQKTYNIELFWRVILAQRSLRNLRMPVTCFITAESIEDRTSWRKIRYSEDHEVIFKYQSQMEEAFQNQAAWNQCQEWTVLRPPLGLQVTEAHGHARRLFGLHLAAVVPDRSAGTRDKVDKTDQDYIVDQNTDQVHSEEEVRFHGVPRKGWDRYFRGMRCQARNVINWKGRGHLPQPPQRGCWLLPTSDEAAVVVAQQQSLLRSLGWRVVSAPVEVVQDLGNKVRLQDFAQA
ncbi:Uncharacterized protein SCF082_LOCUS4221, partial [Durusdinium trenchii]